MLEKQHLLRNVLDRQLGIERHKFEAQILCDTQHPSRVIVCVANNFVALLVAYTSNAGITVLPQWTASMIMFKHSDLERDRILAKIAQTCLLLPQNAYYLTSPQVSLVPRNSGPSFPGFVTRFFIFCVILSSIFTNFFDMCFYIIASVLAQSFSVIRIVLTIIFEIFFSLSFVFTLLVFEMSFTIIFIVPSVIPSFILPFTFRRAPTHPYTKGSWVLAHSAQSHGSIVHSRGFLSVRPRIPVLDTPPGPFAILQLVQLIAGVPNSAQAVAKATRSR